MSAPLTPMERAIFAAAFAHGALDGDPGRHTTEDVHRAAEAVMAWRVFRGRRDRGPMTPPELAALLAQSDLSP